MIRQWKIEILSILGGNKSPCSHTFLWLWERKIDARLGCPFFDTRRIARFCFLSGRLNIKIFVLLISIEKQCSRWESVHSSTCILIWNQKFKSYFRINGSVVHGFEYLNFWTFEFAIWFLLLHSRERQLENSTIQTFINSNPWLCLLNRSQT